MSEWKSKLYENYSTLNSDNNIPTNIDCKYFKQKLLKHIPSDKNIKILDLGCGKGQLLNCIKKEGYKNIKGVDISKEQINLAIDAGIKEVENVDVFEFLQNTKEKYDIIFMMDILEHLKPDEFFKLTNLLKRVISLKGIIIAQVPNASSPIGMRIRYGDLTHETCFTETSIKQGLKLSGFNNIMAYEISPVSVSIKGLIRRTAWNLFILPYRILYYLETGRRNHILSQNMIVVIKN